MDILITGSHGFIGSELLHFLRKLGHRVDRLSRSLEELRPVDVVIHLAGENIATGIWTRSKKQKILESRIDFTRELVNQLKKMPPKFFLCASAVGYYGDSSTPLTEESPGGTGFLSKVCTLWEQEALKLTESRVSLLRFGLVLSYKGGFLQKILPLFRLGLGTVLGGKQMVSWISLQDLVRAVDHILTCKIEGAINVVSPGFLSQKEFSLQIARSIKRHCLFSIPRSLLFFGKLKELIYPSYPVVPSKLLESGFSYHHPDLQQFLAQNSQNNLPHHDKT